MWVPENKKHVVQSSMTIIEKLDLCKMFVNINPYNVNVNKYVNSTILHINHCSVHVYNVRKQYNFTH